MATRGLTAEAGHVSLINPLNEFVQTIPRCFELIHRILRIAVAQCDADDNIFIVRYVEEFFDVIFVSVDEADGAGGEAKVLGDENKIAQSDADIDETGLRESVVEAHDDGDRCSVEIAAPFIDEAVKVLSCLREIGVHELKGFSTALAEGL
jgi:hypothetical protein